MGWGENGRQSGDSRTVCFSNEDDQRNATAGGRVQDKIFRKDPNLLALQLYRLSANLLLIWHITTSYNIPSSQERLCNDLYYIFKKKKINALIYISGQILQPPLQLGEDLVMWKKGDFSHGSLYMLISYLFAYCGYEGLNSGPWAC
jgi:hypothetical protein